MAPIYWTQNPDRHVANKSLLHLSLHKLSSYLNIAVDVCDRSSGSGKDNHGHLTLKSVNMMYFQVWERYNQCEQPTLGWKENIKIVIMAVVLNEEDGTYYFFARIILPLEGTSVSFYTKRK